MIGEVYAAAAQERDNVLKARDAFLEAVSRHDQTLKELEERKLDIQIARREGKAVEDFEKREADYRTEVWWPSYAAKNKAGNALCDALGIEPHVLKGTL